MVIDAEIIPCSDSSEEQSQEQLRYNWVLTVPLVRTVRNTKLADFLRKSKILSKNAKNNVL